MNKTTTTKQTVPAPESLDSEVLQFRAQFDQRSPLDEIIRRGAQEMLQAAIDAEVGQFLSKHAAKRWRLIGAAPGREATMGRGGSR